MGFGGLAAFEMSERSKFQRQQELKELKEKMKLNDEVEATEDREAFLKNLESSKIRAAFANDPQESQENAENQVSDKPSEMK